MKIGDRVRVVKSGRANKSDIGYEGRIHKIYPKHIYPYGVIFPSKRFSCCYSADELELIV